MNWTGTNIKTAYDAERICHAGQGPNTGRWYATVKSLPVGPGMRQAFDTEEDAKEWAENVVLGE